MHTILREIGPRQVLFREAAPLVSSFLLAETFFKFHSFTLECLAFLATWYVTSYLWSVARQAWGARRDVRA
jgi:hypothetical protein